MKTDLEINKIYGNLHFLDNMECLKGEILTVRKITEEDNYDFLETLYTLSEEMLEDIKEDKEEENKSIGQIIDECLKSPEMILRQCNRIAEEAKKETEKVIKENEKLKATIIEKEKHIEYLEGKIEGILLMNNKEGQKINLDDEELEEDKKD